MTEIEKHARAANVSPERVPFLDNLPAYAPLLMEIVSVLRCRVAELEREVPQDNHGTAPPSR